jgi:predicted glycogen debranching enzyme
LHVIHSFNERRIDEHVEKQAAFLITNKKGNYFSLGERNFTHMQGLFFLDHATWELFKTIEDIRLKGEMVILKNNFYNVERIYQGGAEESFNLFNNSLSYSVKNYTGELVLELDFRGIFEYPEWGRIYTITKEGDAVIIRYDKYKDNTLSFLEKTRFLVIKGVNDYQLINEWIKKAYPYDARRGSKSEFYVYKALSINVNHNLSLVFSFGESKEKALEHAEKVYDNTEYLTNSFQKYCMHTFTSKDLALNTALKSLDELLISIERGERSVGIIAGLPWFYQLWARDEIISLKALMLKEKYYLVKNIMLKHLKNLSEDGLIPSRFPGNKEDAKSLDAAGWLFFRLKEYINLLVSKKLLNEYLSVADLITIKRGLEKAIHGLAHHHSVNGLVVNNSQESWMDTASAARNGACIEIQALFLSMISLHNQIASITKSKQLFKTLEKECRELVRKEFFKKGNLCDSVYDNQPEGTIRPNVFLAYYVYPELLTTKEWKQVFDNTLKALWLDWGGLTTINQTNPLFKPEYTGEDNQSYHNGDSWYYINNYAALAMHRLDKNYYAKQIKRIVEASKEEMFFSGFIGCCAELSSAKQMRSEGCLSQAWSAASLIELLYELHHAYG